MHPDTICWVSSDAAEVVGAVKLDFLAKLSFNPADALFSLSYRLWARRSGFAKPLFACVSLLKLFLGNLRKRFFEHVRLLICDGVEPWSEESLSIESINASLIDLIVVNCWGLLPESLAKAPKKGSINIHPSKLPKYRGALPTLWALKSKDTESAVTYFVITSSLADTGRIISQHGFEISTQDDALSLEKKIDSILKATLAEDIKGYLEGSVITEPQTGHGSKTARYSEYRRILWEEEAAADICNKANLYPFIEPGVYCDAIIGKRRLFIKGALPADNRFAIKPGNFKKRGLRLYVGAQDATVALRLFRDLFWKESLGTLFLGSTFYSTGRPTKKEIQYNK